MKRVLLSIISAVMLITISISSAFAGEKLIIGATPVPHAEILNFIKDKLAQKGIDLEIKEFTDYVTPNMALEQGDIDANYFQHKPYLESFTASRKITDLVVLGAGIHVEPIPVFSYVYTSVDQIKNGATVAIPNDPSDEGRALILLHNQGLIKLKDPTKLQSTTKDIVDNPKKLKFKELEAPQIPRVVMNKDVDLAIVNGNFALQGGLDFKKVLFREGPQSPYANYVVVKASKQNDNKIKILNEVIHSPEVRDFINKKYEGAAIAAF